MGIDVNSIPPQGVGQSAGGTDTAQNATDKTQNNGKSVNPSLTDIVTITPSAASLQAAELKMKTVPVVDVDRIEQIRNAIKNGEYKIDADKIADKFISLESSLYN